MVVAWRLTGQRWSRLAVFLLGSAAFIGVASWLTQTLSPSYWLDVVVAAVFAGVWLALAIRPMRRIIAATRS